MPIISGERTFNDSTAKRLNMPKDIVDEFGPLDHKREHCRYWKVMTA